MDPTGTTDTIDARLEALGLRLPGPHPPHDPLDAVVVHGGRARTSGQLPRGLDGRLVHPGIVGVRSMSSRVPRQRAGAR